MTIKRIIPRKPRDEFDYPSAVERLVHIADDAGYVLTPVDAERIWSEYSDTFCAGWLHLHDDDADVLRILLQYGQVIEQGGMLDSCA